VSEVADLVSVHGATIWRPHDVPRNTAAAWHPHLLGVILLLAGVQLRWESGVRSGAALGTSSAADAPLSPAAVIRLDGSVREEVRRRGPLPPGVPRQVTRRRTRAPPLRHAALPAPDGGRSSGSSPPPSDRVETVPARTSGAPGASASSVDPLVQWVAGRISCPASALESTLLSYPADAIRSSSSTPHLCAARSSTSPSASAPVSRRSSRVLRIPAERGVRPAIRRGRPAAALRPRRCPGRCPRRAWHGRGRT
jgi:hypothetical protein